MAKNHQNGDDSYKSHFLKTHAVNSQISFRSFSFKELNLPEAVTPRYETMI